MSFGKFLDSLRLSYQIYKMDIKEYSTVISWIVSTGASKLISIVSLQSTLGTITASDVIISKGVGYFTCALSLVTSELDRTP